MKFSTIAYYLSLAVTVSAHGDHSQTVLKQKPSNVNWQDWHMHEEHNLDSYDGKTFFIMHDLKGAGKWDKDDILNLYGVKHEQIIGDGSGMGENSIKITKDIQNSVVETILKIFDTNKDETISLEEWLDFFNKGGELPDFGYGQGHHLDFESEYEEHHWKQYHAENDPDTLIKHKEDIEHELLHHKHEIEETHDRSQRLKKFANDYLSNIKIENLTPKYQL
ncbi:hypothetical protein KGF54_000680 [Candida jiufengensis]|uniref:uncharacterized protein n=1 Tax=Candida jiufengensis TaxID=497108 RepID=UPI0022250787|nr:uncharacterized protein KGF54_000680 [Candida jiufengensis]KAI5956205.1 hypothetical protein KGF54_000680 [Candida jiufengensis]